MVLAGLYFTVIAEVGGADNDADIGCDGRITPVDTLMIVQVALGLNIMRITTTLYGAIRTTWQGYGIVVDLL